MDAPLGPIIRAATRGDGRAVVALVRASWTGYPGVVFDLDRELSELKEFADHYRAHGGNAWAAVEGEAVVGCIAATPGPTSDIWMLHKLNVLPSARRRGVGRALVEVAEQWARRHGGREMILWSDTRFIESHALYKSMGYEQTTEFRQLNDLSNTEEVLFRKTL